MGPRDKRKFVRPTFASLITTVRPRYSFRASFAFGRSSRLPHLRQRVARIAFRA